LPFLHAAERDIWYYLMTGEESWFFLNISPRRIWTLSRDNVITRPRLDIRSKEFMFMIMWNPSGLYVVNRLPNDTKINSEYFETNRLIPFEQAIFPRGRAPHQKRLVARLDNCSVHTGRASTNWHEEYDIRRISHPTLFTWFGPVTSTCFLQWKKSSNGSGAWRGSVFWVATRDFGEYQSWRIE
jgi:hypothetical protein